MGGNSRGFRVEVQYFASLNKLAGIVSITCQRETQSIASLQRYRFINFWLYFFI